LYLLDTNVVSGLRRPKPHGAVLAWFAEIPADQLFISAVTIGEIQAGIEITREQDVGKALALEAWLDRVASGTSVLPMDAACFREWARLKHRKSNTLIEDAMIAATAVIHNLVVATRNVKDFKAFDTPTLNPFAKRGGAALG
jgi:predicted nucleic acid-binding protein